MDDISTDDKFLAAALSALSGKSIIPQTCQADRDTPTLNLDSWHKHTLQRVGKSLRSVQGSTALASQMTEEANSLNRTRPDDDFRIKMMHLARDVFLKLKEEKSFDKLSHFHFDWWAFPSTVSSLSNRYLNFKMSESEVEQFAKVPGAPSAYLGLVEAFLDVQLKAETHELSHVRMSKVLQSLLEWHKFSRSDQKLIESQGLRFLEYIAPLADARFPQYLQDVLDKCRKHFLGFEADAPKSEDLTDKLREVEDIPKDQQRLTFAGEQRQGGKALKEFNIVEKAAERGESYRTTSYDGEWPVSYHGTTEGAAEKIGAGGYDLKKGRGVCSTRDPAEAERYYPIQHSGIPNAARRHTQPSTAEYPIQRSGTPNTA